MTLLETIQPKSQKETVKSFSKSIFKHNKVCCDVLYINKHTDSEHHQWNVVGVLYQKHTYTNNEMSGKSVSEHYLLGWSWKCEARIGIKAFRSYIHYIPVSVTVNRTKQTNKHIETKAKARVRANETKRDINNMGYDATSASKIMA